MARGDHQRHEPSRDCGVAGFSDVDAVTLELIVRPVVHAADDNRPNAPGFEPSNDGLNIGTRVDAAIPILPPGSIRPIGRVSGALGLITATSNSAGGGGGKILVTSGELGVGDSFTLSTTMTGVGTF